MAQNERGWARWATPAFLLALVLAGWLGGAALFLPKKGETAGKGEAARAGDSARAEERTEEWDIPDEVMGSLGGLIGANLYQGNLNVGFLADAVDAEVYTPEEAQKLLATISALVGATEEQVEKLKAGKLSSEDRESLEKLTAVLPALNAELRELRLYWETEKEEHAARFHKARGEALAALEAVVRK